MKKTLTALSWRGIFMQRSVGRSNKPLNLLVWLSCNSTEQPSGLFSPLVYSHTIRPVNPDYGIAGTAALIYRSHR
jgi:hypothetical protein